MKSDMKTIGNKEKISKPLVVVLEGKYINMNNQMSYLVEDTKSMKALQTSKYSSID